MKTPVEYAHAFLKACATATAVAGGVQAGATTVVDLRMVAKYIEEQARMLQTTIEERDRALIDAAWLRRQLEAQRALDARAQQEETKLRATITLLEAQLAGRAGTAETLADVEKRHIIRVLNEVNGNRSMAARILDVDRRTLYRKLEDFGVAMPRHAWLPIPEPGPRKEG